MTDPAQITFLQKDGHGYMKGRGSWTVCSMAQALLQLDRFSLGHSKTLTMDFQINAMDLTGAHALWSLKSMCNQQKIPVTINIDQRFLPLLSTIEDVWAKESTQSREEPSYLQRDSFISTLGLRVIGAFQGFQNFLVFLGGFCYHLFLSLMKPRTFPVTSLSHHTYRSAVTALPIVGLMAFLIGIVLAYQGASQLKRFGADIFTVDLLSTAILREIGILMTAIIIAGRSGSAFTAHLGTMVLNQECDTLTVMGLDLQRWLVIPRVMALVISLPLLGFFADLMGLLGGAIMCRFYIDLDFDQFLHYLQLGFQPSTFWIGIIKAPFFALVIGTIGCYQGLQVSGGAESLGSLTTRSVVMSVFFVIVLDAFFSIFFSLMNL